MTKEEILSMSADREMDALVAKKVMRWHKDYIPELIPVDKKPIPFWFYDETKSDGRAVSRWWPSTSISAAWEVRDKVKTWPTHLKTHFEIYLIGIISVRLKKIGRMTPAESILELQPEDICRAALLAVMKK